MARIVKQTRSDLRKERYNHLRGLGFSPADARKFRDQSSAHIVEYVDEETERITVKKSNVRTVREKDILQNVRRQRRTAKTAPVISPRLKPISERADDFSGWTRDGFPVEATRFIEEENRRTGRSPVDGYGFRRFYWAYVENIPVDEIGDLADRGDSGELS